MDVPYIYEAARRLLGSKLAVFCPQVFELNSMVPKRDYPCGSGPISCWSILPHGV